MSGRLVTMVTPIPASSLAPVSRAAARLHQGTLRYPLRALQGALRIFAKPARDSEHSPPSVVEARYLDLLQRDVSNVEQGIYPASLLFSTPMGDYARSVPQLMRDLPRLFKEGHVPAALPEGQLRSKVALIRRSTAQGLNRRSEALFDLGVDIVFLGSGDVMRRQILPPIIEFLNTRSFDRKPKIVDVGCGTGRTLLLLARTYPGAEYYGLDPSSENLRSARAKLSRHHATLLADPPGDIQVKDGYFDVVTSSYIFHQRPRTERVEILREMNRVLRPGGLLVVQDSVQNVDAPELAHFIQHHPDELHHPNYRDYLGHDLGDCMREAGFETGACTPAFMAKVQVASKRVDSAE